MLARASSLLSLKSLSCPLGQWKWTFVWSRFWSRTTCIRFQALFIHIFLIVSFRTCWLVGNRCLSLEGGRFAWKDFLGCVFASMCEVRHDTIAFRHRLFPLFSHLLLRRIVSPGHALLDVWFYSLWSKTACIRLQASLMHIFQIVLEHVGLRVFLVFTVVVFCVLHKLPCKYLYMFVCTAVSVTHHAFTSKRPKCTFPNNVRHCWLVRALRCSLKIVVPLETVCSYGGLLTHCPQCCTEH